MLRRWVKAAFSWLAAVAAAAAVCTAARHHFAAGTAWGIFPPHYGYSAYVLSAAAFLTSSIPVGLLCSLALLVGLNRDAWLGVLAGSAYLCRGRWRAACAILGPVAVSLGAFLKPRAYNDSVRLAIWKIMLHLIWASPWGADPATTIVFDGRLVDKAHSDLLQAFVSWGWAGGAMVVAAAGWALRTALRGKPTPARAALVCLAVQSVFDNRLHHPACALTCAFVWLLALHDAPQRPATPQVDYPQGHRSTLEERLRWLNRAMLEKTRREKEEWSRFLLPPPR